MIRHHPQEDMLLSYASGDLSEALSLVVATHAALCPLCRESIARFEALGGVLVAEAGEAAVSAEILERLLARIDEPAAPGPAPVDAATRQAVPSPLWRYLPAGFGGLAWHDAGHGVEAAAIALSGGGAASLLRIAPRAVVPHAHDGMEFSQIIAGGYSDATGHYARGDLQIGEDGHEHRAVIDAGEPCLCLVVYHREVPPTHARA
jgi:putative transcriptional regulator